MEIKQEEELKKVLTDSGLQLSDSEVIKQSYLPYFEQLAKIKEESQKINFENPTELDEKIARELRLRTVKVRTGSKDLKDERKRIHSLRANVEQDAWNLIKSGCELEEENFYQVEKKRELAEKRRKELLAIERNELLTPYAEFVDTKYMNLGEMDEEKFQNLLKGAELQLKQKEAEAQRIAEEEAERKRLEAERIEAQRIENERLKKEAEEKEKIRAKRNEELRPYIVLIRDYNALLSADEETYQKELSDIKRGEEERIKSEQELNKKRIAEMEAREKIAKEFLVSNGYTDSEGGMTKGSHFIGSNHYGLMDSDSELEAFKKSVLQQVELERAKLEAKKQEAENKRLKEQAEDKEKAENEAKLIAEKNALAEQRAKEEAKKKAELAPTKDKLTAWVNEIKVELPIGLENDTIALMLMDKLQKYKVWAKGIIEQL